MAEALGWSKTTPNNPSLQVDSSGVLHSALKQGIASEGQPNSCPQGATGCHCLLHGSGSDAAGTGPGAVASYPALTEAAPQEHSSQDCCKQNMVHQ